MPDYTTDLALVELVAEALGARRNGLASDGRGWFRAAADQVDCYADATAVLRALAAEGRLLPAEIEPHLIEFRADGWTIQHPLSCRPLLFACPVNRAAERDLDGPPDVLGIYECDEVDDEFVITHRLPVRGDRDEGDTVMGEIIRNLTDGDKPLCPNSTNQPVHEAHQLRTRVLDAFYNAAEKDADGEMPEPLDKAYYAAASGAVSDRMDLFRESVSFTHRREFVTVESWWFKCGVCGLILSAQRKDQR